MELSDVQVYTLLLISLIPGFLAIKLGKELYK
uniref:Photosystem I reaction center subunit XII n=1 Tax=Phacus orbicularis TaxID=158829 RepID=A0A172F1P2_9EUGL|nr:PSI M-polypeptide [Phacus orbicularis]